MPTITRCSAAEFLAGIHPAPSPEAVAIQITDPCCEAPRAGNTYHAVHRFEFADVVSIHEPTGEFAITSQQAIRIAQALRRALADGRDVVVHCNRGIYRSGAICEAAHRYGGLIYTNRPLADAEQVVNHRVHQFVGTALLYLNRQDAGSVAAA